MNPLSTAYGRVAGLRRSWYARHPERQKRLDHPVISIGNLVVGGSGKTPVVAAVAELLRQAGERPAILSRGYGRRTRSRAAVVVSDGVRVTTPVEASGDEPQMLARALPGIPVVVAPERYEAGLVAEQRFGSTVMLLDDGFQHFRLARDIDILIVSTGDLAQHVLPSGTLREPLGAAAAADAVLVQGSPDEARMISGRLGVRTAFTLKVRHEPLRSVAPWGGNVAGDGTGPVVAVAGIARPSRFFDALRASGIDVAQELTFRDHHWYSAADLQRIDEAARAVRARVIVTTEKDAVRMSTMATATPWVYFPMRIAIEPAEAFASWLVDRLASARRRRSAAADPAGS